MVEEVEDPTVPGPGPIRERARIRREIRDTVGGLELASSNRKRGLVQLSVEAQSAGKPKFTKNQAIYVSSTRWPWISCGTCVYWDSSPKQCTIVSESGSPDPGIISQDGLCNLWSVRTIAPGALRIRLAQAMVGRGVGRRGLLKPGGTRDQILEDLRRRVY